MRVLNVLLILEFSVADRRLEWKEINIHKLDEDFSKDDVDDVNDLPDWHPDKPKHHQIDINKINARDHLTVWNESKWGKQLGMWVQPIEGLTDEERTEMFRIWQTNMINCCALELTYVPIDEGRLLIVLPDGKHITQIGAMLRADKKCHTFNIENTNYFCAGHPQWDSKNPGDNEEAHYWDKENAKDDMEKKKKKINFWKNGGLGKINKENHGKIEYDYGEDISWFPEEDDEDEIIDPFLDPENSVIQGPNKKKYSKF